MRSTSEGQGETLRFDEVASREPRRVTGKWGLRTMRLTGTRGRLGQRKERQGDSVCLTH